MKEATSMTTEKTLYSKRQAWPSPDLWLLERLVAPPVLGPLDFSPGHPQRGNHTAPCHRPSVDLALALPNTHAGLGQARFRKDGNLWGR